MDSWSSSLSAEVVIQEPISRVSACVETRPRHPSLALTAPDVEYEKRTASEAAAAIVEDGSTVGLGTGSTVGHLLRALARRKLRIRCVASSPATEQVARSLGIPVESFDRLDRLDLAIDGADQIDRAGWLVKGGGGAHTREKIVASAAERFVVIASSDKLVEALSPPVPLELLAYGVSATLRRLEHAVLRDVPPSPDGGLIADYHGLIGDIAALATRLDATPGVVDHGLFPPALVSEILIARGSNVERIAPPDPSLLAD
jgi:ribose 5-phosphate isomerase A